MAIFLFFVLRGVDLTNTASDFDEVKELQNETEREPKDKVQEEEDRNSLNSSGHV